MKKPILAVCAALLASPPLAAQNSTPMVSASDPEGMRSALVNAGYNVGEVGTDSVGDPQITVALADYTTGILFYGCDEARHDSCTSIQMVTGFDRAEPIPDKLALSISQTLRYAAVQIDDEGDPFIGWDVFLGSGIPVPVFLAAIREYERTLVDAAAIIFAEENEEAAE